MRLLVVEDEKKLCDMIAKSLHQAGYEVDTCNDGEEALDMIYAEMYDLIVLDLNLPGMDGMDILRELRKENEETKVLILSARSQIADKVDGLDAGANDYMEKPFHLQELEARVRSLTRRKFVQKNVCLECGSLRFDTRERTAYAKDKPVALTRKENGILEYLLLNQGRPVSQEELIEHVWDSSVDSFSGSIRVHMSSLRKKLKAGLGYDPIVNKNGVYYIDTLQETVTDQGTTPEAVYIDILDNEWDDFAAQFATKVYNSKSDYRNRSLLITVVVALIGGAVTFFVSGRALKPLKEFSETVEKVQAQNLADYTIEENRIAELDRLRTSYNKMLLRLSESFETQRQFTGNAAHELRTPLALIQAQLDLYHTTEHPDSTTVAGETIQMVTEQNERLSKLVRTLLDMSELQTVSRNDRIELHSLIEEVLTDLEPLAQEKKVELIQRSQGAGAKADEELFLTGSDILIYRMLYNLVENAIKYNRENGSVTVSAIKEKNKVILKVSDTGNGIDEAFREQIFEPFFRVDKSRSRELGGVGLGLAMVREVVRVHDGTIEVYTNKHSGTTFEVKMGIGADFEKAV